MSMLTPLRYSGFGLCHRQETAETFSFPMLMLRPLCVVVSDKLAWADGGGY